MSATNGWKGRKKRLFERKEALKKRSNPTEECMNWGGLKFPKFSVKRLKRTFFSLRNYGATFIYKYKS